TKGSEKAASLTEASNETESASGDMQQAGENMKQGKRDNAANAQKSALERMRKAADQLRDSEKNLSEEMKEKFKKLSRKQEEIENLARELEEQLKKTPNQPGRNAVQNARRSMDQAKRELDRSRGEDAQDKEQEAEKALDQAKREIQEKQREYLKLQEEENLFRIKEKLEAMEAAQNKANLETETLDAYREKNGSLSRSQILRDLPKLVSGEEDIHRDTDEVKDKLKAEGAEVYLWVLDTISQDLGRVTQLLGDNDTGELTRSIQGDVARNFHSLLEALNEDLKKKDQQQQQQDEQANQPNRNRIVSHLAEIRMLKRMQQDLKVRLDRFVQQQHDGQVDESDRMVLDRILHQQGSIREVFLKFRTSLEQGH
ncbi:MAG: hypothetical protein HYR85_00100, partial [Planctomycetes bacterium]|nr:hypothetical protein [Planctomycetota bacterium]